MEQLLHAIQMERQLTQIHHRRRRKKHLTELDLILEYVKVCIVLLLIAVNANAHTNTHYFSLSLAKYTKAVFLITNPIDDKIQNETVSSRRFIPNIKRCANGSLTFCTHDNEYPIEHIERLLRKYSYKFADVFGSDAIANNVVPRIDAVDEVTLCGSYEQVIYPTSGTRQDGSEGFIFNTPNHPQGVRVSLCSNLGKPCNLSEVFPNNHRTECKQQVVYRELLSLSPEGRPVKDKFEFPACCSCAVYKT